MRVSAYTSSRAHAIGRHLAVDAILTGYAGQAGPDSVLMIADTRDRPQP